MNMVDRIKTFHMRNPDYTRCANCAKYVESCDALGVECLMEKEYCFEPIEEDEE